MEEELKRPVTEVFSELSPEPVAAASLGQVSTAHRAPSTAGQMSGCAMCPTMLGSIGGLACVCALAPVDSTKAMALWMGMWTILWHAHRTQAVLLAWGLQPTCFLAEPGTI